MGQSVRGRWSGPPGVWQKRLPTPGCRALVEVPGLMTVMSLPPRTENTGSQTTDGALPRGGVLTEESLNHTESRLWSNGCGRRWRLPENFQPSGWSETRLEWPADLMPFQRDGVRALIEMDRLLLSDDMGPWGKPCRPSQRCGSSEHGEKSVRASWWLGKRTRSVAAGTRAVGAGASRNHRSRRSGRSSLAVECRERGYAGQLRCSASGTRSSLRLEATRKAWDVVVLDEAQRIKNRNDTSEGGEEHPKTAVLGADGHTHREQRGRVGLHHGVCRSR